MSEKKELKDYQLNKVEGGWGTNTGIIYYFNEGDCFHDDYINTDFIILDDYSAGVSGEFKIHCKYRYNMNGNIVENYLDADLFGGFTYKGKNYYTDF